MRHVNPALRGVAEIYQGAHEPFLQSPPADVDCETPQEETRMIT
jgi:hypothetical protein